MAFTSGGVRYCSAVLFSATISYIVTTKSMVCGGMISVDTNVNIEEASGITQVSKHLQSADRRGARNRTPTNLILMAIRFLRLDNPFTYLCRTFLYIKPWWLSQEILTAMFFFSIILSFEKICMNYKGLTGGFLVLELQYGTHIYIYVGPKFLTP